MDSFNMQTKIVLKTGKLFPQSFCNFVDGRKDLIAIGQSDGISLFNV